jgi:hypothetical protein
VWFVLQQVKWAVEVVPAEIHLVGLGPHASTASRSLKKEFLICSLCSVAWLQVLRKEDLHQERSSGIFFFSLSRKSHSQKVSKSVFYLFLLFYQ